MAANGNAEGSDDHCCRSETDRLCESSTGNSFIKQSVVQVNGQMELPAIDEDGDDRSETSSTLLLTDGDNFEEACDGEQRRDEAERWAFNHDHCHSTVAEDKTARNKLIAVSALCFVFMVAELTGGLIAGSLAIASDASHLACDLAGFLVSLFSIWLAKRPPTLKMSFGYHRAEVLGALISIIIIWVVTAVLVFLGIKRILHNDYDIDGHLMLITASIGVAFNILMGIVLHSGIANCNIKSSFGHGHSHSHGHSHHGHGHHGHDHHGHSHRGHDRHGHSHGDHHRHSHSLSDDEDRGSHGSVGDQRGASDDAVRPVWPSTSIRANSCRIEFRDDPVDDTVDLTSSTNSSTSPLVRDDNENLQLPRLSRSSCASHHREGGRSEDDDELIDVVGDGPGGQTPGHNVTFGVLQHHQTPPPKKSNINVRAAMVHVIGDFVQSVGVLIAAIIINCKPEFKIADPICTFIFSVLVLFTTVSILKDVVSVIMEAVPADADFKKIKADLKNIHGVMTVHSLNIWALTIDRVAVNVHLGVALPCGEWQQVLKAATTLLRKKYNMFQSTIQVEQYEETMRSCNHCHSE